MFQSTIIVDPKSEIKGKQDFNTYIVKPTILDRRESIRIKDVQDMLAWCSKTAFAGTHKLVVIEELHKSSDSVPHALLKILEEPPQDTQIVIIIDRAESALSTIRSRCAVIAASELTVATLEQLGLQRISSTTTPATIAWQEFVTKAKSEQLGWLVTFIKSKKDGQMLLQSWQEELVDSMRSNESVKPETLIKQLALLEEVNEALKQNVLPRLALHYLHIELAKI